jgi:hypothetical protein
MPNVVQARPTYGVLIRARDPFILMDTKADAAHKLRIRYLSRNTATDSSGTTEVSSITQNDQIPDLPETYHEFIITDVVKRICEDLSTHRNRAGTPKYPGLIDALALFRTKYAEELHKYKNQARKRYISDRQNLPDVAGSFTSTRRRRC